MWAATYNSIAATLAFDAGLLWDGHRLAIL